MICLAGPVVASQRVIVVVRVHVPGKLELTEIAQAMNGSCPALCASQHREQHCGENGDDSDNDEQFNEREPPRS
jgi:hypothetical protein